MNSPNRRTGSREVFRLPHPQGGVLAGHWTHANDAAWTVAFFHGLGSRRDGEKSLALETACVGRGWNFVALDCRGHGESTGTLRDLTCAGLLSDIAVLHTFLAARGIERLFPVGSSMGGWLAVWSALSHPDWIPACALIAPALHFPHALWRRLSERERQFWQCSGVLSVQNEWLNAEIGYGLIETAADFTVERLTAAWSKPLLIFHGMRDEVVPYRSMLDVVERLKGGAEVRLYRDGDHRLVEHKDEMAAAACAFFGGA